MIIEAGGSEGSGDGERDEGGGWCGRLGDGRNASGEDDERLNRGGVVGCDAADG